MANAEMVTVLSSQYRSFKIANIGEIIGAFEQDRQRRHPGAASGAAAPMVPMDLRISGRRRRAREFHMRLAEVPQFTPMLVGQPRARRPRVGELLGRRAGDRPDGPLPHRRPRRPRGAPELRRRQRRHRGGAYVLAVAGY